MERFHALAPHAKLRVYEQDSIQPEVRYFRTLNLQGRSVPDRWSRRTNTSWYEAASIPEETTNQSVHKNNL